MARYRLNNYLLVCVALTLSCLRSHAQQPRWWRLDASQRNTPAQLHCLASDQRGYLWLAARGSLLRFDGQRQLTLPYPDSLQLATPTTMLLSDNQVIIGFSNGVVLTTGMAAQQQKACIKVCNSPVTCLLEPRPGTIIIATDGEGIFVSEQNSLVHHNSRTAGLADDYVHEMVMLAGKLVLATDLGISLCTISNDNCRCNTIDTHKGLSDNLSLSLAAVDSLTVAVGMHNGTISLLHLTTGNVSLLEKFNALQSGPVQSLLRLGPDLLTRTEGGMVYVLPSCSDTNLQQFQLPAEYGNPLHWLADAENNVVMVTGGHEVVLADFHLQYLTEHDEQSFANAQCLLADEQGNIWFANDKGIFRHAVEFSKYQYLQTMYSSPADEDKIISMCMDKNGKLWFGTFGSGVGCIDITTGKVKKFTERDGLLNNNVLSMVAQDTTIWMATLGGVCSMRMDDGKPTFSPLEQSSELGNGYIYSVSIDRSGRLLLGTDGQGLVIYEHGKVMRLLEKFPASGKAVVAMTMDDHGFTWYYSPDAGVYFTDGESIQQIDLENLGSSTEVYAMHAATGEEVALLTSNGIAYVSYMNVTPRLVHEQADMQADYLNVITRDMQKNMWFATSTSMIRFNESITKPNLRPVTNLEQVFVNLQVTDTTVRSFKANQNHFTFHFTSIWWKSPQEAVYQYQLAGFENNWNTTTEHIANYPRLPPGTYTFTVRSSADGNWANAHTISYSFTIDTPLMQRTWFIALALLVVVSIVYLLLRLRLRSISRRELLQRKLLQGQFETLRNQVNPHFLFNAFNTLVSIISKDKESAIDYVEKLSDYFRIVLEQRHKDTIALSEELELVRAFIFLQQKRFFENLMVNIELNDEVLQSRIPPMTLQLLVENAIKHNVISKTRPLQIIIRQTGDKIEICNNLQPKLSPETSTGIGLSNIRSRYEILFGRSIEVLQDENKFCVLLPVVF
ncbi:MAG: histidine kinase [Flavobacteriales bacterium]